MENRENEIERLIKGHLQDRASGINGLAPKGTCPTELELSDYLENRLSREKEDLLLEHIAACPRCLSLLELARESRNRMSQQGWLIQNLPCEVPCRRIADKAKLPYSWVSNTGASINSYAARKEKGADMPSAQMLKRAKDIVPEKPKKGILNYKWQILAAISFLFSFILTRYFLQFLILAVIFSLKWVFDTASTRTLIMIYEAWRKKDKGTAQRIIQDFQDKIEQRK